MVTMSSYSYAKGYCIHLSDGNGWWITGYEDSIKYTDLFADIMCLKECLPDKNPKFIFFNSSDSSQLDESFIKSVLCDSDTEWKPYVFDFGKIWHGIQSSDVIVEYKSQEPSKDDKFLAMWNSLCFIYQKCLKTGALPIHGGLAEYKGKGILFPAPGGTGKSTTCRRLPPPWKALCDDENLIIPDRDNKFLIHPFPTWSDYLNDRGNNKWDTQRAIPLSAIFFLDRSENDEVIRLSPDKTPVYMTGSSYQVLAKAIRQMSKEEQAKTMSQAFNNAFDILKAVPIYQLKISLTGRFWEKVEEVLD